MSDRTPEAVDPRDTKPNQDVDVTLDTLEGGTQGGEGMTTVNIYKC